MLDKNKVKTYIKNLIKLWYSKRKVCRILDINYRTLESILVWHIVSESTKLKIINNYDNYIATFISLTK